MEMRGHRAERDRGGKGHREQEGKVRAGQITGALQNNSQIDSSAAALARKTPGKHLLKREVSAVLGGKHDPPTNTPSISFPGPTWVSIVLEQSQ